MKKTLISFALMVVAIAASAETKTKAQNDTTLVNSAKVVRFEKETYPSKTGEVKESYTATLDGETYPSNKTSAKRYALIRRHGGTPAVVIITTPSGKKRIAVL